MQIHTLIFLTTLVTVSLASAQVTTIPLGSSRNLYTITNNEGNKVLANQETNTVVFIHCTDHAVFPSDPAKAYRYDISKDGGATWTLNQGPVNALEFGNSSSNSPEGVLYNPTGNTNPDNAYLLYLDAWRTMVAGGSYGLSTGVARLDHNPATFTQDSVSIGTPEKAILPVASCNGTPGVFWAVSWRQATPFLPFDYESILLFKGTWNTLNNDVDWVLHNTFTPPFDTDFDGNPQAAALNMAFDPSGQFGYIGFVGDIDSAGDNVLNPAFYSSVDGGNNWSGPISVDLQSIDTVVNGLTVNSIATTGFHTDIAVDVRGDVHFLIVIGSSGQDYAISTGANAGLKIYDITNASPLGQAWNAILIDDLETFRGDITAAVTSDNLPQISLGPDGSKVFFGWCDSDASITGGTNMLPNFKTRGLDVNTYHLTPVTNWTENDPVWSGAALFATMSPTCFDSAGTYTLPVVLTELNVSGSESDPAYFHYVKNISYHDTSFSIPVPIVLHSYPVVSAGQITTSVYPNPGDGTFYFEGSAQKETDWELKMYTATGEFVSIETFQQTRQLRTIIDARLLPPGIYLLKVETANGVTVNKVILH